MPQLSMIINGVKVSAFIPDSDYNTSIYHITGHEDKSDELWEKIRDCGCAMICVSCNNWNDDLTPWSTPAVFKNGEDFGGKASSFLATLVNDIVPEVEKKIGVPECRGIIGYSLAGLFAVYAFYESNLFNLCGAPSGSIWYDDFAPRYRERRPSPSWGSIFFSIGDKEGNTRNDRMARNERCMKILAESLSSLDDGDSFETYFGYTKGTHFDNANERIAQSIRWLLGAD